MGLPGGFHLDVRNTTFFEDLSAPPPPFTRVRDLSAMHPRVRSNSRSMSCKKLWA